MGRIISAAFPEETRLWAGEALRVTAAVANDGEGARMVADPTGPSPFEYRLVPRGPGRQGPGRQGPGRQGNEGDVQIASADRLARELTPDPTPAVEPSFSFSLAPGSAIDRVDEIAIMRAGGFSPGSYDLFAHYRDEAGEHTISPRVPVDITVPRVELFDSHVCPFQRSLSTVAAVMDDAGDLVILGRESVSEEPRYGVFHRRHRIPRPAFVTDLTTTIDAAEVRGGRWLAWIEGRAVGALRAFGDRTLSLVAPTPLDVRRPRFARPGFQLSDGSGFFVVVGQRGGETVAEAIGVTARGVTAIATLPLGGAPSGEIRATLRPRGEGAWLSLVWAEVAGGGATLYARSYDAALRPTGDARAILRAEGPLLAWDLDPSPQGGVVLLSGPGENGMLAYNRASLDGARPPTAVAFAPPAIDAQSWAVSASAEIGPVLAHGEGRLVWTTPGVDKGYHVRSEAVPAVRPMRVFHGGAGGSFAQWVDPSFGVQQAYLPAGEGPARG